MADFHRKTLPKSKIFVGIKKPCDDCDHDDPRPPPPPPPPPSSSSNHSLSPFLIFMFCGLAVSFVFVCYLTLAARYRRRQRSHENSNETHEDFVNEDLGPAVIHHPIWLINTIGLDPSEIEAIHVFKYKKDEGLIEGTDCSVCLSEFENDESLRLLPKCSHAFHVPCIDTWLRSHKNCPLCRAPIIKNMIAQIESTTIDSNSIEPHTTDEISPSEDSETVVHHHTIEVENNREVEKTSRTRDETYDGVRVLSDLVEYRVQEELVDTRRSVSMDETSPSSDQSVLQSKKPNSIPETGYKRRGSSSSIRTCSKSSSFGRSLRKTSSFTNRCPQNRSF